MSSNSSEKSGQTNPSFAQQTFTILWLGKLKMKVNENLNQFCNKLTAKDFHFISLKKNHYKLLLQWKLLRLIKDEN